MTYYIIILARHTHNFGSFSFFAFFFFIALFSHSFFVRSFVCVFVQQPQLLLFAVIEAFVSFCHSSTPRSMFSLLCIHGIYNRGSHRVYLPNRQKHKNKIICRMQFISSSNVLSSAVTAKHLRFCQHILLSHYTQLVDVFHAIHSFSYCFAASEFMFVHCLKF